VYLPLITAALTIWGIIVSIVIILQRRSAAATLAWIFALLFLPIVGLVVYRLIGPQRLERRKLRRLVSQRAVGETLSAIVALENTSQEHFQLAQIGIGLGQSAPLSADDVTVYMDGASHYAALLSAIAAATEHIHLEYYIWEPDQIGTQLRDALIARARAGVEVRMLVDGTGSANLKKKRWLVPLREAGVQVAWFAPVRLYALRLRRPDFRTHRKIVVCDGRVGFTGGMNITDNHSADLVKDFWRDTHVRLSGAVVWSLQRLFLEDWQFASDVPCEITPRLFPQATTGEHLVQVLGSGPDTDAFAIHKALFTACNQATERLWLTTPYFVPDESLLMALISAALRDVDVRLIVPARGDSQLVDYAARSYFPELLSAGVKVYEYTARFIHAKTLLGDHDVSIIGTANLDNRSFRLNFEVCAIVFGTRTNTELATAFQEDLRHCTEITAQDLARQRKMQRLAQGFARLISPLL
jgi:cardiolipin synthase